MDEKQQVLAEIEALIAEKEGKKPRVTTQEQALANAMAVETDTPVEEPWFSPLDVIPLPKINLVKNAAKSGSAIARTMAQMLENPAERSRFITRIKNAEAVPYLRNLLNQGATQLTGKIDVADSALNKALTDVSGEVNPDIVKSIFPNYAKVLESKKPKQLVEIPQSITKQMQNEIPLEGFLPQYSAVPVPQARVPLTGKQMLRLKRGADKVAKYSKSDFLNPLAKVKNQEAQNVANIMRGKLHSDPATSAALSAMEDSIKKRSMLDRMMDFPTRRMPKKSGNEAYEALRQVDQDIGTNLAETGVNLSEAQKALDAPIFSLNNLGRSLPVALVKRSGYATAQGSQAAIRAADDLSIPALAGVAALPTLKSAMPEKGVFGPAAATGVDFALSSNPEQMRSSLNSGIDVEKAMTIDEIDRLIKIKEFEDLMKARNKK